jgi:hypothetical protein
MKLKRINNDDKSILIISQRKEIEKKLIENKVLYDLNKKLENKISLLKSTTEIEKSLLSKSNDNEKIIITNEIISILSNVFKSNDYESIKLMLINNTNILSMMIALDDFSSDFEEIVFESFNK